MYALISLFATSRVKNPKETAIFTGTVRSCGVDENKTLAYKPAKLSAMTRCDTGSGSSGAGNGPFWAASSGLYHQFYRQIARSAEKNP
jgi:hypothetical protein